MTDSQAGLRAAQECLARASHDMAEALATQAAWIAHLQRVVDCATEPGIESPGPTSPVPASHLAGVALLQTASGRLPVLDIGCFSRFTIQRGGVPLLPCKNRSGQTVLRYLAVQPRHDASTDALVDALWPEDPPEVARHKLHCAASALRRSLNGELAGQREPGYLRFEGGSYALGLDAVVRVDLDDFVAAFQAGTRAYGESRLAHFAAACRIYTGPILLEDLYADWSTIRREQMVQMHLTMCATLAEHALATAAFDDACDWSLRILAENRCDEAAYRTLIAAHAGAGRRAEAFRQYRRCEEALAAELGVRPMPKTTALLQSVLRGESVSRTLIGGPGQDDRDDPVNVAS